MAVRRERADAARNRRAILQATETLLAEHRPSDVSIERVAAKAGVSKGTVFHRFGSRTGLMVELMKERAAGLQEAVTQGAPPLGPGAPAGERLLAFLSAVVEVVGRNKGLLAALGVLSRPRATAATVPSTGSGTATSARCSPRPDPTWRPRWSRTCCSPAYMQNRPFACSNAAKASE